VIKRTTGSRFGGRGGDACFGGPASRCQLAAVCPPFWGMVTAGQLVRSPSLLDFNIAPAIASENPSKDLTFLGFRSQTASGGKASPRLAFARSRAPSSCHRPSIFFTNLAHTSKVLP